MNTPVIETARLTLRPPAMEDFPRWAGMMADAEASKFIGGPMPAETAWRGFMTMAGAWSLTGVGMFSLIERETGLWLGRIGPWTPLGWPGTEVGWGLHPDAQGKGYGVEAATAAIDYAFDVLDWTEVILHRPGQYAVAATGRAAGLAQSGPDEAAAAVRRRLCRPLGPEPRAMARPRLNPCRPFAR